MELFTKSNMSTEEFIKLITEKKWDSIVPFMREKKGSSMDSLLSEKSARHALFKGVTIWQWVQIFANILTITKEDFDWMVDNECLFWILCVGDRFANIDEWIQRLYKSPSYPDEQRLDCLIFCYRIGYNVVPTKHSNLYSELKELIDEINLPESNGDELEEEEESEEEEDDEEESEESEEEDSEEEESEEEEEEQPVTKKRKTKSH